MAPFFLTFVFLSPLSFINPERFSFEIAFRISMMYMATEFSIFFNKYLEIKQRQYLEVNINNKTKYPKQRNLCQ